MSDTLIKRFTLSGVLNDNILQTWNRACNVTPPPTGGFVSIIMKFSYFPFVCYWKPIFSSTHTHISLNTFIKSIFVSILHCKWNYFLQITQHITRFYLLFLNLNNTMCSQRLSVSFKMNSYSLFCFLKLNFFTLIFHLLVSHECTCNLMAVCSSSSQLLHVRLSKRNNGRYHTMQAIHKSIFKPFHFIRIN